MEDLYSALIGEGAGSGEKTAVIAAALRRRNQLGQLGMLTGDKMLSQVGKGLSGSADEYAEQLQTIRERGIDNDQTRTYQSGQLDHMRDSLAETRRNNDLNHQYRMLMAAAAGIRAEKTGGGKIPKLRQGDIKELQDLSEGVATVQDLMKYIDEGGKFGAVEVGGVPVPGLRTFKNYAASKGLGSDEDKTSFKKKQEWDRMYTLVTRNRLFGATLTPNEQAAWEAANPSVSQTDEQIRDALPVMAKIMKHRMDKKVAGLTKEGYSAEAMADYADVPGINVPDGGAAGPVVGEVPSGGAPAAGAKPKRLRKVNGQWVPVE